MARKPLSGTVAATVLEHGTGALNVDGCRIGTASEEDARRLREWPRPNTAGEAHEGTVMNRPGTPTVNVHEAGRWPANVLLDESSAALLDAQTGQTTSGAMRREVDAYEGESVTGLLRGRSGPGNQHGDTGGASRFFYVAKASSAERNAGLDGFEAKARSTDSAWIPRCEACGGHLSADQRDVTPCCGVGVAWDRPSPTRNVHPTVKPIDLMRWLVRLVTPPGGIVLDPFTGSGTTGIAAALEGFDFIGIEREAEYVAIAEARIAWWEQHPEGMTLVKRLEAEAAQKAVAETGQLDMFGGEAA